MVCVCVVFKIQVLAGSELGVICTLKTEKKTFNITTITICTITMLEAAGEASDTYDMSDVKSQG